MHLKHWKHFAVEFGATYSLSIISFITSFSRRPADRWLGEPRFLHYATRSNCSLQSIYSLRWKSLCCNGYKLQHTVLLLINLPIWIKTQWQFSALNLILRSCIFHIFKCCQSNWHRDARITLSDLTVLFKIIPQIWSWDFIQVIIIMYCMWI